MADESRDGKPFLARWSERKRAVQTDETPDIASGDAAQPQADIDEAELEANRAAAEAIDLESLTDTSDYSPFFRAGVSAALKRAALQKLWRSNPVFAVLDGLNDYDESYVWPASGSEMVRTAWKVGRGFLTEDDQAAAEERAAARPAENPTARRETLKETVTVTEESVPEAEVAPDVAEADANDVQPDREQEPAQEQDEESARPKVSLTRRVDLTAFARERDDD